MYSMNEFLDNFFGWPTLILLMIPIVILVRLFIRTSRWSILKVSGISIFGTLISSAWLFYASLITSINLGGEWGRIVGLWFSDKIGDSGAFYLLSAGLFVWIILSALDIIISGVRYFINKPYIREIVVEVEREITPVPKDKQKQPKIKTVKKPSNKPDDSELKTLQEYDDLGYFKSPTPAILNSRNEDIKKVSPAEIQANIEIIKDTLRHQDSSTTANIYARTDTPTRQAAMNKYFKKVETRICPDKKALDELVDFLIEEDMED